MPVQQPALLTSWKEVAAYLGKGVRTVQRWETRLGMPVRRPDNSKSGIIQVSREELDRWLESRWSPRSGMIGEQDNSSSKVVSIHVAASRHLRRQNSELVSELRRSLRQLSAQCEMLGIQLNRAERRRAPEVRTAGQPRRTA